MANAKYRKADEVKINGNRIFSPVRQKWVPLTPEERVRQEYLTALTEEYGFAMDQIAEEEAVPYRGMGKPRADFLIWKSPAAKNNGEHALIVVECKADNVTINLKDYEQGANYAQYEHARFFVTHNNKETKYWRVDASKRMPNYDEIEDIPHADASDKEINQLLSKLRVFKEKEFADLLHQCHNVIRNREKKDPAAAFDEIAKILFVKVWVERELAKKRRRKNLFSVEYLDEQLGDNPLDMLFSQTKQTYSHDKIFEDDERINLKPATGTEIVRLLEKYNLSATSEDIKGVAFERFLGKTFRGEIGQFFTPRTIVEFMVHMVGPQEGDIVCDPASGSGGFLIRVFEIVREQILADIDRQYNEFKKQVESDKTLDEDKKVVKLRERFDKLQKTIDQRHEGSRMWTLSNRCIYGTDANDRMARTSKMNMIMHGDGHGGVHHHDGFLNVNGIFEGRFDIILTNPPFGANVEPTDKITEQEIAVSPDADRRYTRVYGKLYTEAQARVQAALNKPIASLFDLPKSPKSRIKTEILFIERCLDLLKPGGRMGIVLPEGIFNNPSLAHVREFTEDRAYLKAVVSLPQETFVSSGASVKCSLLFLQKFTEEEKATFDATAEGARAEIDEKYAAEIAAEETRLDAEIAAAKKEKDTGRRKKGQKELRDYRKQMDDKKTTEARQLLKERFDYPIFMYEAEKVGITATGDEDANELYPQPDRPDKAEKTCLEWYREFLADPQAFANAVEGE